MVKKHDVPDAWDDDWEEQADQINEDDGGVPIEEVVKVSKAEKLARHEALNKKLWDSA